MVSIAPRSVAGTACKEARGIALHSHCAFIWDFRLWIALRSRLRHESCWQAILPQPVSSLAVGQSPLRNAVGVANKALQISGLDFGMKFAGKTRVTAKKCTGQHLV